jgi:hypothetical protein
VTQQAWAFIDASFEHSALTVFTVGLMISHQPNVAKVRGDMAGLVG